MIPYLLIAVLLTAATGPLPAPAGASPGSAPAAAREDPVQALGVWVQRQRRTNRPLEERDSIELRALLKEVEELLPRQPARRDEALLALVDLAVLGRRSALRAAQDALDNPDPSDGGAGLPVLPAVATLGELARDAWDGRVSKSSPEVGLWLADSILKRAAEQTDERRAMAARLLGRSRIRGTMEALVASTDDANEETRLASADALVGWAEPRVHRLFIEALDQKRLSFGLVREHFAKVAGRLGPQAQKALQEVVARGLFSENWRDAARAGDVIGALSPEAAVPILIEALELWLQREEEERGSRRIRYEIRDELARLSGRRLGDRPDRWRQWWRAVSDGRVPLAEDREEPSTATFFGLRPITDRVVFVVDRSGSMSTSLGTGGEARWEKAVDELFRFLEASGDGTRFGLVLFNHRSSRWRGRLVKANTPGLTAARAWLEKKSNGPDGGTQLGLGIQKAVGADRRWRIDAERLEADTVIVLCDGEDTGPREWLEPVLRQSVEEAQLVFHCVRIGPTGDGVLEALAEGTGGDFVRIDG